MTKSKTVGLRFPSGRPIASARNDAKKLARAEGIPLIQAQNIIASRNGCSMSWDNAVTAIRNDLTIPAGSPQLSNSVPILEAAISELQKQINHGNRVFASGAFQFATLLKKHISQVEQLIGNRLTLEALSRLLTGEGLESLLSKMQEIDAVGNEISELTSFVADSAGIILLAAYLRRTIESISAKVTFLAMPPGAGKTTILFAKLLKAMDKEGHSLLVCTGRDPRQAYREIPSILHSISSEVDCAWSPSGALKSLSFPSNPAKLILAYLPDTFNAAQSVAALNELLGHFDKWEHFSKIHTICIDEMPPNKPIQERDFRDLDASLQGLTELAHREVVLATQSKFIHLYSPSAIFPLRVIGVRSGYSPSLANDTDEMKRIDPHLVLIEHDISEKEFSLSFQHESNFLQDVGQLVIARARCGLLPDNPLAKSAEAIINKIIKNNTGGGV